MAKINFIFNLRNIKVILLKNEKSNPCGRNVDLD